MHRCGSKSGMCGLNRRSCDPYFFLHCYPMSVHRKNIAVDNKPTHRPLVLIYYILIVILNGFIFGVFNISDAATRFDAPCYITYSESASSPTLKHVPCKGVRPTRKDMKLGWYINRINQSASLPHRVRVVLHLLHSASSRSAASGTSSSRENSCKRRRVGAPSWFAAPAAVANTLHRNCAY